MFAGIVLRFFDIMDALPPDYQFFLDKDERQRASRMSLVRKNEFVRSRCVIKQALAHLVGKEPNQIKLTLSDSGKLRFDWPTPICFSLSHSEGMGIVAFSADSVGVDIEKMGGRRDWQSLSTMITLNSERTLLKTENDFYALWTLKESVIKAADLASLSYLPQIGPFNPNNLEWQGPMMLAEQSGWWAKRIPILADAQVSVASRYPYAINFGRL